MKMDSKSLLKQMSTEELESLTSVVQEGIATDIRPRKIKKFTAIDLWNIRRRLKEGGSHSKDACEVVTHRIHLRKDKWHQT